METEHTFFLGGDMATERPNLETRVAVLETHVGQIQADVGEIKALVRRIVPRLKKYMKREVNACRDAHRANCPINKDIVIAPTKWAIDLDILKKVLIGFGVLGSLLAGGYSALPDPHNDQTPKITVGDRK
jgi:hypothetical protein